MAAAARAAWAAYQRLLHRFPIRVNAVQTGILMGTGDVLAQTVIETNDYRLARTARFTLIGVCAVGPGLCIWYRTLDRICGVGHQPTVAIKKMLLDQLICAPIFLANFLVLLGILQRQSAQEIQAKISKDYKDILLTNWTIWPIVQMSNFYFIPSGHRVLVANFVALFWNTYLSWKANKV